MSSTSQLTPLLPTTPYLLAYVLPLLLLSLLLTFAGTFLTLDRSRSFPSTDATAVAGKGYAALPLPGALSFDKPKRRGFNWTLEGGIGGLAGGYAFGLHLSTALALLIPATTPSASLSPKSFLAVWVLSCIVTTPISSRYRYAALAFFGISGGTLTALALCIVTHPSLQSRIILVSIALPLFTLLVLLTSTIPVPRLTTTVLHPLLRLCTASTGAFGVVMSIALLLKPQEEGWANAWERLWMANGPPVGNPWGSAQEQGLSAAYAVFLVAGMATDWALRKWIGECPDEKWDNYLAHYAANLPNQAGRAGSFQPLTTIWDRIFPSSTPTAPFSKEIIFPSDTDMKSKLSLPLPVTMRNTSPGKLNKAESGMELTRAPTSVELLKKKRSKARRGAGWKLALEGRDRKERKPVKFGVASDDSDSDDDSDEDETKKASSSPYPVSTSPVIGQNGKYAKRPWTVTNAQHSASSSSTPTLVGKKGITSDPRLDALDALDYDQEIAQLKQQRRNGDGGEELDYSDYEEDLTAQRPLGQAEENAGWSPAFLKRHQSQNHGEQLMPMPMPVPATPSLIKALDRLAIAQREAFGTGAGPATAETSAAAAPGAALKEMPALARSASSTQGHSKPRRASMTPEDAEAGNAGFAKETSPKKAERAPRWEEFWREVRTKAQS